MSESTGKRKLETDSSSLVAVPKRTKQLATSGNGSKALLSSGPARTSNLHAPVMQVTGHESAVFTAKFAPDGNIFASGSFDRNIFLWRTYGENENYAVLKGHKGPVVELHWSKDGKTIVSASTDKTCAVWDAETCSRIRRLRGHSEIVNSCSTAGNEEPMVVSGSDDNTVKVWDSRQKKHLYSFENQFQVTAVAWNGADDQVISGGIDNTIKVWDLRKQDVVYTLAGHTDTITGLKLSPDGTKLLSNSMDSTVRIWDTQPFCSGNRQLGLYQGAQHNFEKNLIKCAWTPDSKHIGCGSADRNVYIWNVATAKIAYCLPGHKASVNDVDFHPNEPIVLSASSDKRLYLGELHL